MALMEQILSDSNISLAQRRVIANQGSGGMYGVSIEDLSAHMLSNRGTIKSSILSRSYRPHPVRRVEIPKEQGVVRKLGIPTVVDRTIQQAISQVLSPIFEREFLPQSYGFRPARSCEQAIVQLLSYMNEGYEWVVDIDLEKFFDNVPQDRLMGFVGCIIQDPENSTTQRWAVRPHEESVAKFKRKLGISDDLAKRTSVCGNRYQWMVTKTCIVRSISKKSLSQKGLVSCQDYYTLRHALKPN